MEHMQYIMGVCIIALFIIVGTLFCNSCYVVLYIVCSLFHGALRLLWACNVSVLRQGTCVYICFMFCCRFCFGCFFLWAVCFPLCVHVHVDQEGSPPVRRTYGCCDLGVGVVGFHLRSFILVGGVLEGYCISYASRLESQLWVF